MEEYSRLAQELPHDTGPGRSTSARTDALPEQNRPSEDGRIFPCPSCSADMVFHIGQQNLSCDTCGYTQRIEIDPSDKPSERDLQEAIAFLRSQKHEDTATGLRVLRCSSCGSNMEFYGTLATKECCYCGSDVQEDLSHDVAENRLPIDGVLPFLIPQATAVEALNRWVSSRWFAPNHFTGSQIDTKLTGLYLPFFTYDSVTFTVYTGQRGTHYWVTTGSGKNKRRVRRTSWRTASGSFQEFFDDVLIMAAEDLPRKLVRGLEPWPLHLCLPFNQQVMAGFVVHKYNLDLERGFGLADQRMEEVLRTMTCQRIGGDEQRIDTLQVHHSVCTYKHLLLPVWTVVHKHGDKTYRLIVNATTGEVQGERPYSAIKIAFAAICILALITIIYLRYTTVH